MLELYPVPDLDTDYSEYCKYARDILAVIPSDGRARLFIDKPEIKDYGEGIRLDEIFDHIKYLKFEEAKNIIDKYDDKRKYDELCMLAEKSKSMVVYLFIEYLIENSDNYLYNKTAFDILTSSLRHIKGPRQMAAYYAKRIIEVYSDSDKYIQYIEELRREAELLSSQYIAP